MDFDAIIVGGGIVGLACLAELAGAGKRAVLFERHHTHGLETSSRNSEVLHSGIHYPPGSLKAKLCVSGSRLAYTFARESGVRVVRCGKITIARDSTEIPALENIRENGEKNGVQGLRFLSRRELADREPFVRAAAGLLSPSTGVVSVHEFMDALARHAQTRDGVVVYGAEVHAAEQCPGGWKIAFSDSEGLSSLCSRTVINAAGLEAQNFMRSSGLDPDALDLTLYPCKGCYFAIHGEARKKIRGLVYPVPDAMLTGLGIHTVVGVGDGVRLGPDTEYIPESGSYEYGVDPEKLETFFAGASRYLPFLRREDLSPDMAGIRPKISGPGQPARDFYIADEKPRGYPGFINMAGLESPGLTSCMAIGEMVCQLTERYTEGQF